MAAPRVRFRIDLAERSSVGPGENLSSRSHSGYRFSVSRGAQHRDELSTCLAFDREPETIFPGARDGGKQGRHARRRDVGH